MFKVNIITVSVFSIISEWVYMYSFNLHIHCTNKVIAKVAKLQKLRKKNSEWKGMPLKFE